MIRQILPADLNTVNEIYNYYVTNTVVSLEENPPTLKQIEHRLGKVTSAGLPWLVAEEKNEILGYAYASTWNTREAYKHTAEVSVYLSPSHTGKGIGSLLYEALFADLKALSFHVLIGGITVPNPASTKLHEKFGMTKVAHFGEVGYKFGAWHDVGYWQINLNAQ